MMTGSVEMWWAALCVVALLNVAVWALCAFNLKSRQAVWGIETFAARRLQVVFSGIYVFGCAYRSFFPVYDVPRLCLVDSWVSSVIVGRSVATLAEVCFVAQWALMLREVSDRSGCRIGRSVSLMVVPMILLAEICSWYSVLTTSNIGHVIEESLWGLAAALMIVSLAVLLPRCVPAKRPLVFAWCAASASYVAYMFLVDVPRYWTRWVADEIRHRSYISVWQGLFDTSHRWLVSRQWSDWHGEVVWMTLYFSVAVWLSIALIHAPAPSEYLAQRRHPSERRRIGVKGVFGTQP